MEMLGAIIKECKNEEYRIEKNVVRLICFKEDKIFTLYDERHDEFVFPGIECENPETRLELIDQFKGIIGVNKFNKLEEVGIIEEYRPLKENDGVFNQFSYYYSTKITKENIKELEEYRISKGFTSKWVTIDEAIKVNSKIEEKKDVSTAEIRALHILNVLKKGLE